MMNAALISALSLLLAGTMVCMALLKRKLSQKTAALEQLQRILERESMTDEATGLLNRRQLDTEIEREIERSRRYKRPLAGIIVGIDDFEKIAVTRGPAMAEAALKKTGALISGCIRKVDFAGRVAEATFLILLPESIMDGARTAAFRIQDKIRNTHIELPRPGLTLTASIGLFAFPDCGFVDKKLLLETAEVSLLKAQKEGKNRIASN